MFTGSSALRSLFTVTALVAAAVAHGQTLTIDAANASNDAIGSVSFLNQTFNVQNKDGGSLHSVKSLAFVTNTITDQLDLLAADNAGGEIVRYCGNFTTTTSPNGNTTGTVVWNETQGGPTAPDGLSVDSAGNLFVVNSGSGTSVPPQLWVLQNVATSCATSPPPPKPTIVPIDSNYGAKQTLEETLIATTAIPLPPNAVCLPSGCLSQISPGDLLVLTANPALVLLYPGSNGQGPCTAAPCPTAPFTLINLPTGVTPGGMAWWPLDTNQQAAYSLLVTASTGTIYEYTFNANFGPNEFPPPQSPPIFVSGLGNGEFKVRTGRQSASVQNGTVFAFVADNNGGRLLEFNAAGQNISTVTTGVQHPQGLAVSNAGFQLFSDCASGCDVVGGGLLTEKESVLVKGINILGDVCFVDTDPRIPECGSCTNAALGQCTSPNPTRYQNGLPLSHVCAGYGSSVVPNSACGASGSTGHGFLAIKVHSGLYSLGSYPLNGTPIDNDSNVDAALPGPNNPTCHNPTGGQPFSVLAWAPYDPKEGKGILGNTMVDIVSSCQADPVHGESPTGSVVVEGLGLNADPSVVPGGLPGYAVQGYTDLLNVLTDEYTDPNGVSLTPPSPSTTPPQTPPNAAPNFTYQLQQCIQTSQGAFGSGSYKGAALELLTADQDIVNAVTPPPGKYFFSTSDYPNPSVSLEQRALATWYRVDVENAGDTAFPVTPTLPPPPPPAPTISQPSQQQKKASLGIPYTFSPTTADFAGHATTLTYTVSGLPSGLIATVNNANDQLTLSGTPTAKGNFAITIIVSDGCTTTELDYTLKVTG